MCKFKSTINLSHQMETSLSVGEKYWEVYVLANSNNTIIPSFMALSLSKTINSGYRNI